MVIIITYSFLRAAVITNKIIKIGILFLYLGSFWVLIKVYLILKQNLFNL